MNRNGKGSVERRFIDWDRLKRNHENMEWPIKRRAYNIIKGLNNLYTVTEHKSRVHKNVLRTVASGVSKEYAELLVKELEYAVDNFISDNGLEK